MNVTDIKDRLELTTNQLFRSRTWYIQATCATSGDGVYEGFDQLVDAIKKKK